MVGKLLFIIGRVAGLSAEVLEEYAREKPMRIKIPVAYDGVPPRRTDVTMAVATGTGTNDHRRRTGDRARRCSTARAPRCAAIEAYDQATVDRLCQAIAWAGGNETTATRLANMSVDESGMGSREPKRRAKVQGVLRDALRQKSIGVIEEIPEKGIVKYAKPAGVIASLIPVTSPYVTPITHRDLRDQVQGRGDLLAASRQPQDDERNRARDARGAAEARRARRSAAVRRAAEHPARQRADGACAT